MLRCVVLLGALLVVGGCSTAPPPSPTAGPAGGDGGGTPGTSLTACDLVTPTDIDAALGLDEGTAVPGEAREVAGDDPAASECSYLAQPWGGLVVQVSPTLGARQFESTLASAGDRAEQLDVGDGGMWLEGVERGYFLKGSVMVIIQITRLVEEVPLREPTIELGEAAIARL